MMDSDWSLPSNVSAEDQQLYEWHNRVRLDPTSIIGDIQKILDSFNDEGTKYKVDTDTFSGYMDSCEGPGAYTEAIAFLK